MSAAQTEELLNKLTDALNQASKSMVDRDRDWSIIERLTDGVRATLIMHSTSPWSDAAHDEWMKLTGMESCTTRNLCDFLRASIRAVLATMEGHHLCRRERWCSLPSTHIGECNPLGGVS